MKASAMNGAMLLLAIAATACPISASAQDTLSGNWLYEAYRAYTQGPQAHKGLFLGYVSGVVDAEVVRTAAGYKAMWCAPKEAVMSQYIDIVGRYLESNPDKRHLHRGSLAIQALSESWPCRR